MRFLLLSVLITGCGATSMHGSPTGPSAQDQEAALEIVWEGVYGMTVDQRPAITWLSPDDTTGEYSTIGHMNIVWTGTRISDTHFSAWLEGDREWLVYPSGVLAPAAEVDRLTATAQDSLQSSGL